MVDVSPDQAVIAYLYAKKGAVEETDMVNGMYEMLKELADKDNEHVQIGFRFTGKKPDIYANFDPIWSLISGEAVEEIVLRSEPNCVLMYTLTSHGIQIAERLIKENRESFRKMVGYVR